jgi:stage V sporulation protein D (sporulation-specific penicillin-binding protein)
MERRAGTSMLRRLIVVAAVLGVACMAAVIVRLYIVQVRGYEYYQKMAVDQQTQDKILYPKRGTIYDANMRPLAISADTQMITLEAVKIDSDAQGEAIAEALSRILEVEIETVRAQGAAKKSYAVITRGVEEETVDEIRAFIAEYNAAE